MNHYIVAPAINLDNATAFVDCLDPELARERLILVDNTETGEIAVELMHRVLHVRADNRNLGVAASWNHGCRYGFAAGAYFVTIASTSVRMWDGGHGLCRTADLAAENSQWPYGFESMNGWHLFTVGYKTWAEVGEFDERFYPAYFEDNDYIWRMRCAGILEPAGGDRAHRMIPWIGALKYADETASAIKSGAVSVDLAAQEARYVEKWGGKPGEETVRA